MTDSNQQWLPCGSSREVKEARNAILKNSEKTGHNIGISSKNLVQIRVVMHQKSKREELMVHNNTTELIEQMKKLDSGLIEFISSKDDHLKFSEIEEFPTGEKAFKEFFMNEGKTKANGLQSVTLVFNIHTTTANSLNKMKQNSQFIDYLKYNKIFTHEHPFKSVEFARIGFLCGLRNRDIHISDFQANFKKTLQESIAMSESFHFLPTIAINTNITRHRYINKQGIAQMHWTEAFEIECEKESIELVTNIIMDTTLDSRKFGKFVPFSAHRNDPELLLQMIAENNYYKQHSSVIHITGLHPEVLSSKIEEDMTYFEAITHSTSAIRSLERTKLTDQCGKWKAIIHHNRVEEAFTDINGIIVSMECDDIYIEHKKDNADYATGVSASVHYTTPHDYTTNHLRNIREHTTFYSEVENNNFNQGKSNQIRNQSMKKNGKPTGQISSINFGSTPKMVLSTTSASTTAHIPNAWNNRMTMAQTVVNPYLKKAPVQQHTAPVQQQRTDNTDNESNSSSHSSYSRLTDDTVITLLRQVQSTTSAMRSDIDNISARVERIEQGGEPTGISQQVNSIEGQLTQLGVAIALIMKHNNIKMPDMNIPMEIETPTMDTTLSPPTNDTMVTPQTIITNPEQTPIQIKTSVKAIVLPQLKPITKTNLVKAPGHIGKAILKMVNSPPKAMSSLQMAARTAVNISKPSTLQIAARLLDTKPQAKTSVIDKDETFEQDNDEDCDDDASDTTQLTSPKKKNFDQSMFMADDTSTINIKDKTDVSMESDFGDITDFHDPEPVTTDITNCPGNSNSQQENPGPRV